MSPVSITLEPVSVGLAVAAELTGISETTLRSMIDDGRLVPVPHVGKRVIVSVAELRRVFGAAA